MPNPHHHTLHRSSFTLIELLVVIAIISVLASLLLPSLNRAKEAARQTLCVSNTKQLSIGVFTFANDHRKRTPYATNGGASEGFGQRIAIVDNPTGIKYTSILIKQHYLPNEDVFICPSAYNKKNKIQKFWSNKYPGQWITQWNYFYGINIYFSGNSANLDGTGVGRKIKKEWPSNNITVLEKYMPRLTSVKTPSKTLLITDYNQACDFVGTSTNRFTGYAVSTYCNPMHKQHRFTSVAWADGHATAEETIPWTGSDYSEPLYNSYAPSDY